MLKKYVVTEVASWVTYAANEDEASRRVADAIMSADDGVQPLDVTEREVEEVPEEDNAPDAPNQDARPHCAPNAALAAFWREVSAIATPSRPQGQE